MKSIRFERHDSVGHIVLANPPLNLIATEFSERLSEAVHEASESEIRALLIRAEGPNFSQGGDILDFIDKEFNAWLYAAILMIGLIGLGTDVVLALLGRKLFPWDRTLKA
ncbi:hypothetical protein WI77_29720 [Burkholderia ubonensis]|nr:hypothetical protein [Burkholderia ubonensis]KVD03957.1 hypothetical protein WI77_29720 [Burkholderia ubonensis]